jgi:RimJ/RimL family protein N-acetyltransferase
MPELETERLTIRPFVLVDLEAIHGVLSEIQGASPDQNAEELRRREQWLRWTVANYQELARLKQPPYGDRAIVLKRNGQIIGSVGLVPSMGPFGQLPGFPANQGSRHYYPEVGLFWVVDRLHRRNGYATEAGQALVEFALDGLRLGRIVATTEHTNEASIGVMRKLGMRILRNPTRIPEWFQVVGVREREES